MSSKLFCMRKRNTAKKTSRNTTSFTPGKEALPSIRWLIWMSFTVNTRLSTPQPMGSIATSQTPCAMSYMDMSPAVVSICEKSAPMMPS